VIWFGIDKGNIMKKLTLVSSFVSASLAISIGVLTACFAKSPETMTRSTTVAVIFGIFSLACWGLSFTAKE